ncbi:hypothetical protein F511_35079 [Dorcoceras hygrometricum]|uniref:Uncharacterized protein n=1 Tax=Dorcoceras hygrometricum TaxID=472368 RepID=A0A2Z7B4G1_9LAMI|nr:hypothetical protein F511_35079 [Dorcoceras hygrometricum]
MVLEINTSSSLRQFSPAAAINLMGCRGEAPSVCRWIEAKDVRLAEPTDYKIAVNKDLRAEHDWKEIDEERQLKHQAFQHKDRI